MSNCQSVEFRDWIKPELIELDKGASNIESALTGTNTDLFDGPTS
ncbi:MAG: hypothetical protein AAGK02_16030 [Pseudomonadota bacterium]